MDYDRVIDEFICCPYDHSKLTVTWTIPNSDGQLFCPACKRMWKIGNGILCVMPDYYNSPEPAGNDDVTKECLAEISARDAQARVYEKMFSSRKNVIELQTTLRELNPESGDVVAELGAGTGRTLTYSERCKLVIACDYSLESLRELRNKDLKHVIPVQADATQLPLTDGCLKKVLAVGLLQHIPSQRARRQHLKECHRILVGNGEVLMSGIYNFNLVERMRDVKMVYTKDDIHGGADGKMGYHTNNTIYYYNFDIRELITEVNLYFEVLDAFGFYVKLPFLGKVLEEFLGPYRSDCLWQRTRIGNWFGQLLLIRMKKVA